MKKALTISVLFLAGLGVAVMFHQSGSDAGSLPAEEEKATQCAAAMPSEPSTPSISCTIAAETRFESEIAATPAASENTTEPPRDNAPPETDTLKTHDGWRAFEGTSADEAEMAATETTTPRNTPVRPEAPPTGDDPYHTDIYPENVYSEELLYDSDGNLIGKTTTIPTEFGPDTIWIDGHAYYDVPGFGLIEWGGPSHRTEDYIMYENGNKVGIMGGEDEAPPRQTAPAQPEDWPEPTGEVIDQTISEVPERNSTPPDWRPNSDCEYGEGE